MQSQTWEGKKTNKEATSTTDNQKKSIQKKEEESASLLESTSSKKDDRSTAAPPVLVVRVLVSDGGKGESNSTRTAHDWNEFCDILQIKSKDKNEKGKETTLSGGKLKTLELENSKDSSSCFNRVDKPTNISITMDKDCLNQQHRNVTRTHNVQQPPSEFKGPHSVGKTDCFNADGLKCSVCSKEFKFKSDLLNHAKSHSQQRDFHCTDCSKSFKTKGNLVAHRRIHSGLAPYSCKIEGCNRTFKQVSGLQRHLLAHQSVSPFPCNKCEKSFKSQDDLDKHDVKVHDAITKHICLECHKKFKTKESLTIHARTHSNEEPFVCKICQKTFKYRATWKDHVARHNKSQLFSCNKCSARFSRKSRYAIHFASCSKDNFILTELVAGTKDNDNTTPTSFHSDHFLKDKNDPNNEMLNENRSMTLNCENVPPVIISNKSKLKDIAAVSNHSGIDTLEIATKLTKSDVQLKKVPPNSCPKLSKETPITNPTHGNPSDVYRSFSVCNSDYPNLYPSVQQTTSLGPSSTAKDSLPTSSVSSFIASVHSESATQQYHQNGTGPYVASELSKALPSLNHSSFLSSDHSPARKHSLNTHHSSISPFVDLPWTNEKEFVYLESINPEQVDVDVVKAVSSWKEHRDENWDTPQLTHQSVYSSYSSYQASLGQTWENPVQNQNLFQLCPQKTPWSSNWHRPNLQNLQHSPHYQQQDSHFEPTLQPLPSPSHLLSDKPPETLESVPRASNSYEVFNTAVTNASVSHPEVLNNESGVAFNLQDQSDIQSDIHACNSHEAFAVFSSLDETLPSIDPQPVVPIEKVHVELIDESVIATQTLLELDNVILHQVDDFELSSPLSLSIIQWQKPEDFN